jgi:hypothetical protein
MTEPVTLLDLYDLALLGGPDEVERLVTDPATVIAEQSGGVLIPNDFEQALNDRFKGDYDALLEWIAAIAASSPTARRIILDMD